MSSVPFSPYLVYKRYKRFHFQCIIYNGDSDLFLKSHPIVSYPENLCPEPNSKTKKKKKVQP